MNTHVTEIKKQEQGSLNNFQHTQPRGCWIFLGVVLLGSFLTVGCSSPPKPSPQPSTKEIRSDADRFFEKMEQEKEGKPEVQP